jgi:predicted dithiol-disulfide oxidoreductase (DUF899 family)
MKMETRNNMGEVVLDISTSLDAFIADADDRVDQRLPHHSMRILDGLLGMYQWLYHAPRRRNETGNWLAAPLRRVRHPVTRAEGRTTDIETERPA